MSTENSLKNSPSVIGQAPDGSDVLSITIRGGSQGFSERNWHFGEPQPVKGSVFDYRSPCTPRDDLDHNFCLGPQRVECRRIGSVSSDGVQLVIETQSPVFRFTAVVASILNRGRGTAMRHIRVMWGWRSNLMLARYT